METLNLDVKTWLTVPEKTEFQNQIMKEEKEYIEKQEIVIEFKKAIFNGIESGIAENFNPKSHLEALKREHNNVRH